jgi:hypothetical protein
MQGLSVTFPCFIPMRIGVQHTYNSCTNILGQDVYLEDS